MARTRHGRRLGSRPTRAALLLLTAATLLACGSPSSSQPGSAPASPASTKGPQGDTWTWDGGVWAPAATRGPAPRFDSAMAFDEAHGQTILFGGSALLEQFGDTWSWDGRTWKQLQPAHHPVALSGHRMAYDAARRQLILFGGAHGLYEKASPITDTWAWDGTDWARLATSGPPSLDLQQMAFDASSGKVILFGGSRANRDYSSQTWAWDGHQWTQVGTTHNPSPRNGVALAFDRSKGSLVLFGGAGIKPGAGPGESGLPLGDQWVYSGGDWAAVNPTPAPSARANAAFARDPVKSRLLLFSGTSCPFGAETWSWDGSGWTRLRPSRSPSPRAYAAVATDSTRGRVVLFGGLGDTPCL